MLTRSAVLATILTVGLVAAAGSSALAVAFVPGDASGVSQSVQAIAAPDQDPSEGSVSSMVAGGPATITVAKPITIDGGDESPASETAPKLTIVPTGEPVAPATGDENTAGDSGTSNSGSGNSGPGNAGPGNSGKSAEDKAKEDKAKKDKEEKEKKAKEDKAKKDKEEKEKKEKEDKAKKDKEAENAESDD